MKVEYNMKQRGESYVCFSYEIALGDEGKRGPQSVLYLLKVGSFILLLFFLGGGGVKGNMLGLSGGGGRGAPMHGQKKKNPHSCPLPHK